MWTSEPGPPPAHGRRPDRYGLGRRRLHRHRFRRGLLWQLVPASPRYLPDFLTPPPQGLTPDLGSELTVLRATPPEVLRADVDLYDAAPPPAVRALRADPVAGLRRLADEITAYWGIALAPDWARIRLLLEAEVQHRAQYRAKERIGIRGPNRGACSPPASSNRQTRPRCPGYGANSSSIRRSSPRTSPASAQATMFGMW